MKFVVDFVIWIIHLLQTVIVNFFALSYHAGNYILNVFNGLFCIIYDIYTIIIIVLDEIYRFYNEVKETITDTILHARSDANSSIDIVLDSIVLIAQHLVSFVRSTKVHTRLLATSIGTVVRDAVILLFDIVDFLVEACWFLLMLIPRIVFYTIVKILDFFVVLLSGSVKVSLQMANEFMHNMFQYAFIFLIVVFLYIYRVYVYAYFIHYLVPVNIFVLRFKDIAKEVYDNGKRKFKNFLIQFRKPTVIYCVDSSEGQPCTTLCITCYDRPKCILLLPCRHLCLCKECKEIMYNSSLSVHCPLCRSPIERSMIVFT